MIVGPGRGGGGTLAIFADSASAYRQVGSLVLPWAAYNVNQGEVRPTAGNLDSDHWTEVMGCIGRYPGPGGYLRVFDNVVTSSSTGRWIRYVNGTYNLTNGETFPTVGQFR